MSCDYQLDLCQHLLQSNIYTERWTTFEKDSFLKKKKDAAFARSSEINMQYPPENEQC